MTTTNSLLHQISPWFSSLVIILFSIALSCLITACLLGKYKNGDEKEITFRINSNALHKQVYFWIAITTPFFMFCYLEYFVFTECNIHFDVSGFEVFLNKSKLPLSILALLPISLVVVSTIHRTVQTETQINATEQKNKIDSYYSQLKFITDEIKNIHIKRKLNEVQLMENLFDYKNISEFSDESGNNIYPDKNYKIKKNHIADFELKINNPISLYKKIFNASSPITGAVTTPNKDMINALLSTLTTILKKINLINEKIKLIEEFANQELDKNLYRPRYKDDISSIEPYEYMSRINENDIDIDIDIDISNTGGVGDVIHDLFIDDMEMLTKMLNIDKPNTNLPFVYGEGINYIINAFFMRISDDDMLQDYLHKVECVFSHTKIIIKSYYELIILIIDIFSLNNEELSKVVHDIYEGSTNFTIDDFIYH